MAFDVKPPTEPTEQLARVERNLRASHATVRSMLIGALVTFPVVAAFHVEHIPRLKLVFDFGSLSWIGAVALTIGFALHEWHLSRERRRLIARIGTHAHP
jgi:hypothetical protein